MGKNCLYPKGHIYTRNKCGKNLMNTLNVLI